MSDVPIDLYNQSSEQLAELLKGWGQPAFRAKQLYRQLYVKRASSVAAMSDLPKALRESMEQESCLGSLRLLDVQRGDGGLTRKAVFALRGGETIEAVLMIYPDRATVCVSSQAGCAMGCTFCATGQMGFKKNLTAGEMIQQVLWASREIESAREDFDPGRAARYRVRAANFPKRLSNVVFMGMGEPFVNYNNWWRSVERLHDPEGFGLGARSFTVSTVGHIPGIQKLAEAPLQVNLAISLHYVDDERRSASMPVNRRWPLAELMAAARAYAQRTRRRVSFEYVLLEGVNDSAADAARLAELLSDGRGHMLCHVNLIPWNPVEGTGLSRSTRDRIQSFKNVLDERRIPATIRIQRGGDIDAACGQLAGKFEG